ncbi:hypothetical protein ACPESV_24710 [Streptomyces umbrinus]|uniref:hypothetical protein n=1 Tax=Streptomyces umbrinus TaxID=67370 RepID=UPI003C2D3E02
MPQFLINGLADMSVARAVFISGFLFLACACVFLALVEVRHFVPRSVRHALPVWLRRWGLRASLVSARVRLALVEWLMRRLTPTTSSSSAPKKGAL